VAAPATIVSDCEADDMPTADAERLTEVAA
jgi:hypothetical protein